MDASELAASLGFICAAGLAESFRALAVAPPPPAAVAAYCISLGEREKVFCCFASQLASPGLVHGVGGASWAATSLARLLSPADEQQQRAGGGIVLENNFRLYA